MARKWAHLFILLLGLGGCATARPTSTVDDRVFSRFEGRALSVEGADPGTPGAPVTHTVEPGDTLWSISRRHGVDVHALAKHNGIEDASRLSVGQTLKIPGGGGGETTHGMSRAGGSPSRSSTRSSGKYPLLWPVDGEVSSRFGSRWGRQHDGIDISAPLGTPVRAAADGYVVFSERQGSYGNLVVLKHEDNRVTVYAHHQRNLVRQGQKVRKGQTIARVGSSGRSTGPHLHFEVREGTNPVNPLSLLPP